MSGPIVVGYDGTDGARAAVARGRAAGAAAAAPPVVVAFAYGPSPLGGEVADLAATLRERGEALTAEALDALRGRRRRSARRGAARPRPAEALVAPRRRESTRR